MTTPFDHTGWQLSRRHFGTEEEDEGLEVKEWLVESKLSCDPASLSIFETQCATKHKVKIGTAIGPNGRMRAVIKFKARDTSGAFTSGYGEGSGGHKINVRITHSAPGSRRVTVPVSGDEIAFAPMDDGWAEQIYDIGDDGTYGIKVTSMAGGVECCNPGGYLSARVTHEGLQQLDDDGSWTPAGSGFGGAGVSPGTGGGLPVLPILVLAVLGTAGLGMVIFSNKG